MNKYVLILVIFILGCTPKTTTTEVYSILYDTTDPLQAIPQTEELMPYMNIFDANKTVIFRYGECSSLNFNISQQLKRDALKTGLLSNQVQEKQKQRAFKKDVEKLISSIDTISQAKNSSIFEPIISELQLLSTIEHADRKTLIIYSDLMDHTDWISLYRTSNQKLLYTHSPRLTSQYLKKMRNVSLDSTITLRIIYIPKNNYENQRYMHLKWLYTEVFKQHNISVSFSANLDHAVLQL